MKESEGDFQGAINLYLKAGLPAKAARLAISRPEITNNSDTISRIAASLIKGEFYERVSGLFLSLSSWQILWVLYWEIISFLLLYLLSSFQPFSFAS